MTTGIFVATGSALLVVIGLAVPLPFMPPHLDGGRAPAPGAPPICLALEYDSIPPLHRQLPVAMRLRATAAMMPTWFAADGRPKLALFEQAWWQPAGPDSIDIGWHHSPVIRLAAPGRDPSHPVRGRLAARGVATLFEWFSWQPRPDRTVTARVTRCAAFDSDSLE